MEWIEKTVDTLKIDEWQSAKCSACGRYHTTPYTWFFVDYKHCTNCGEKRKEED